MMIDATLVSLTAYVVGISKALWNLNVEITCDRVCDDNNNRIPFSYIETSSTLVSYPNDVFVAECLAFACDENGNCISGVELPGSSLDTLNHGDTIKKVLDRIQWRPRP